MSPDSVRKVRIGVTLAARNRAKSSSIMTVVPQGKDPGTSRIGGLMVSADCLNAEQKRKYSVVLGIRKLG